MATAKALGVKETATIGTLAPAPHRVAAQQSTLNRTAKTRPTHRAQRCCTIRPWQQPQPPSARSSPGCCSATAAAGDCPAGPRSSRRATRPRSRPTAPCTRSSRAQLELPRAELERLWTPAQLENLGRTYWLFLTRVTLGVIRVVYSRGRALGRAARQAAHAAALRAAGVHARARPRADSAGRSATACWSRAPGAAQASSRSRSAATRRRQRPGHARHRRRGRELLPGDRLAPRHAPSTRRHSRSCTCSSRTPSCARWRRSSWPSRKVGASATGADAPSVADRASRYRSRR